MVIEDDLFSGLVTLDSCFRVVEDSILPRNSFESERENSFSLLCHSEFRRQKEKKNPSNLFLAVSSF